MQSSDSELTKALAALHADASGPAVAAFRSCLCAIALRLQSDPQAGHDHLAHWWHWLDQEGYDRESFAAALQQICTSSLSQQDWLALQAALGQAMESADGLEALIDHLQSRHPDLTVQLERLEAIAFEEQQALEATAAGKITKKDILIGAGVYVGYKVLLGGALAFVLYRHKTEPARQQLLAEKVEKAEHLLTAAKHHEATATQTVREDFRVQLSEIQTLAHDSANATRKVYKKYNRAINEGFENLRLPEGAKFLPICKIANEGEQYILHKGGRDMVKLIIDGEIYHFYRSSGKAGKDQEDWPIDRWYPVNGIGPDHWINKSMVSAKLGSHSKKIREIQELLFLQHEESIVREKGVSDQIYLDLENERLFIESVNKGLDNVFSRKRAGIATNKELLRKAFSQIIKERNPRAYYALKEELKLDSFIAENIWDPAMNAKLEAHWLMKNPATNPKELANEIRPELARDYIKRAKESAAGMERAIDLNEVKARAEALALEKVKDDSVFILDTQKIIINFDKEIKKVEKGWVDRIIKEQGSKIDSSLNKYAKNEFNEALHRTASQADADLINFAGKTESRIVSEERRVKSTIAQDAADIENAEKRLLI